MTQDERRIIFWLLKKNSSYTTWSAFAQSWETLVKAYSYALKHATFAEYSNEKFFTEDYCRLLDIQIALEKGVSALKKGKKSVFSATPEGYFKEVVTSISYAWRKLDREEYVYEWAINEEEIFQAVECAEERQRHIGGLFEQGGAHGIAPMRAKDVFTYMDDEAIPKELPPLPSPADITVPTGGRIRIDGIWEPEWKTQDGEKKGCMNYLLNGSVAPYYHDTYDEEAFPVTWRLIWEDTRYRDGTIPEEEQSYLPVSKDSRGAE